MKSKLVASFVASAASVALATAPALARSASQMTDLVGVRASSGEGQLEARGFTHIVTTEGEYNTKHSYWWNSRDKNCLHVETYKGQYTAITDGSKGDCHQGGGNTGAAVAGVAVGAALIAALASSHKSHHHQNGQHSSSEAEEAQYERGFADGLHASAYYNYDRSDHYSRGYEAGVEQRRANTARHSGRAGYTAKDPIRGPGGLEEKCKKAVARETGARVTGTNRIEESQAAIGVYLNVQGAQAPWLCLGYRDGSIAEVRYSGSEGGA